MRSPRLPGSASRPVLTPSGSLAPCARPTSAPMQRTTTGRCAWRGGMIRTDIRPALWGTSRTPNGCGYHRRRVKWRRAKQCRRDPGRSAPRPSDPLRKPGASPLTGSELDCILINTDGLRFDTHQSGVFHRCLRRTAGVHVFSLHRPKGAHYGPEQAYTPQTTPRVARSSLLEI